MMKEVLINEKSMIEDKGTSDFGLIVFLYCKKHQITRIIPHPTRSKVFFKFSDSLEQDWMDFYNHGERARVDALEFYLSMRTVKAFLSEGKINHDEK